LTRSPSDGDNALGRRELGLSRLAAIELRRRLNALNCGIAKLARERGLLLADLERLCHRHGPRVAAQEQRTCGRQMLLTERSSYGGASSSASRRASCKRARSARTPPLVRSSANSRASARLRATVACVLRPRASRSDRSRLALDRPASAAAAARSSSASRSESVTSFPITSSFTNRGAGCPNVAPTTPWFAQLSGARAPGQTRALASASRASSESPSRRTALQLSPRSRLSQS
jgi:hypothetical protein